jgi:hypothetical protein
MVLRGKLYFVVVLLAILTGYEAVTCRQLLIFNGKVTDPGVAPDTPIIRGYCTFISAGYKWLRAVGAGRCRADMDLDD